MKFKFLNIKEKFLNGSCEFLENLFQTLLNLEGICVILIDSSKKIISFNNFLLKITEFEEKELLNKPFTFLYKNLENEPFWVEVWKNLNSKNFFEGITIFRKKNLTTFRVYLLATVIKLTEKIQGFLFLAIPLGIKEKGFELSLRFEKDPLTDLPSLTSALKTINMHIQSFPEKSIIFIIIDIWGFTYLLNYYGVGWTQALLKRVGERLLDIFGRKALVARTGTDDFFITFLDFNKKQIPVILEEIFKVFSYPFIIEDAIEQIFINIGGSIYPEDGLTAEDLYKKSFLALGLAKKKGPNHFLFYNENYQKVVINFVELKNLYLKALKEKKFSIYVQPIFNLRNFKIAGFEILARLLEGSGKVISPSEFLDILEDTGLIRELEFFILKELKNLLLFIPEEIHPSINLSYHTFFEPRLLEVLEDLKKDFSHSIIIEITEKIYLDQKITDIIYELKNLNYLIALDDFGTGYSSLSYLLKIPVDFIKIDRSFVKEISKNERIRNFIKNLVKLLKNLDLQIIAEGVEIQEELNFLKFMGCDYAQGFFFYPPMSLEAFFNLIKKIS